MGEGLTESMVLKISDNRRVLMFGLELLLSRFDGDNGSVDGIWHVLENSERLSLDEGSGGELETSDSTCDEL